MATVRGTVISVALETDVAKNGGGTYKGWELVYRTPEGEVRSVAKPVQGLRYAPKVKAGLESLKQGDEFTLTQEKNENGFNNVLSVEKGNVEVAEPTAVAGRSATPVTTARANTYETPEERAVKQKLIVRQSSLTSALEILKATSKTFKKEDVFALGEEVDNWVYQKGVEHLEDDIPY